MTGERSVSLHDDTRLVYGLFIAAAIASCAYCIVMAQFNGDFFPQPVFISVIELLAVLVACLLPYLATWRLAAVIERFKPRRTFEAQEPALLVFLVGVLLLHIAATLLYGVGILNSDVYNAPPQIVPFIQLLNRLDPFYLGAFYILATPKRAPTDLLAITLMILTGMLRAGLGAFAYVMIVLLIKYRSELRQMFRRMPAVLIGGALVLPTVISTLYDIRGRMRGDQPYDYSLSEMLLGRFVGRLSAYSNIAYMEQFRDSFKWSARSLEHFFYEKQGLVTVVGGSIAPALTPERLLISGNVNYQGYSSFMTGIPGNLMIAWFVSPWVALLNLCFMLGCIVGILWLSRYLGGGRAHTFGLAMVVYPVTSGVANEFTSLLLNTALFVGFSIMFARRGGTESLAHGR